MDYRIKSDILKDFLTRRRAEVTNVILWEYDAERHIKNEKEISYKDGREEGIKEGIKEGNIMASIEIYSEYGLSEEEICARLMKKFQLDEYRSKQLSEKIFVICLLFHYILKYKGGSTHGLGPI